MISSQPDGSAMDFANVFIVIAAYNEEQSLGTVVEELRLVCENVVVVDDGSRDRTSRTGLEAGATVLRHPVNRGQGAALQTGITYAVGRGADVVVTFDADGQHRVSDLAELIRPIREGRAHISLGSRFLKKGQEMPFRRRLLLKAGVLFTRFTSGVRLTDTHNGLRAFSREAAGRIDIQLDRMAHASEIIDQISASGLPYLEVPVRVRYTEYSMAKGQSGANAVRVAADYLLGRIFR